MAERVYFDWNATAPLRPEAREAVLAALDRIGNPSSVHAEGRAARQVIDRAREAVAALVGGDPRCVTFTSGGTEANVLALSPGNGEAGAPPRDRLLVSAIEHPSVLAGGRFAPESVEQVPVTVDGIVDLKVLRMRLAALAAEGRAPLVSLMLANNETGVIQPVADAAEIVREAGALLHVDAVQAAGRIPIDINALGADLLTLSGHKVGAPKGVGALIRRHRDFVVVPLITGGGQEGRLRAGTENVAGIAGFGAAAAAAADDLVHGFAHITELRDRIERYLSREFGDVTIFGAASKRIPNTTLFATLPGVKAETAVIALDLAGVAVSSGAACSSGKVAPSHVLAAMEVPPELARGAIRISLGATTTETEVESFQIAWNKVLRSLLKGSRTIAA